MAHDFRACFETLERRHLLSLSPIGPGFTVSDVSAPSVVVPNPGADALNNGTPTAATNGDGTSVVVWTAPGAGATDGYEVFARRYARGGAPLGDAFVVDASSAGDQVAGAVAIDSNGAFVVSWISRGAGPTPGVYVRRYSADGQPLGGESLVSPTPAGATVSQSPNDTYPALASDGRFIVAWDGAGVNFQRFTADGVRDGNVVQAWSPTTNDKTATLYGACVDGSGTYTLVFDVGHHAIDARRFGTDGAASTSVVILTTKYGARGTPAMDASGNLLMTWEVQAPDAPYNGLVFAQRFGPDLSPLTPEFQVTDRGSPSAAVILPDGEFAIGYTLDGNSAPTIQTYSSSGVPTSLYRLTTPSAPHSRGVAFTAADDGSMLILAVGGQDPDAIRGQWYASFVNGATLGDRVWLEANTDGIQNAKEVGMQDVTVTLFNSDGVQIQPTQTSNLGTFSFDVMPGQAVYLDVTLSNRYYLTPAGRGADGSADSDFDPVTHRTALLTLAPDEIRNDVDAGVVEYGYIGGTIFHDANLDGVKQATEAGLGGLRVFADLNGNGSRDPGEPSTVAAYGRYSLASVPPGDMTIRVEPLPGFDPLPYRTLTLPPGYYRPDVDLPMVTDVLLGIPAITEPGASVPSPGAEWPAMALDGQDRPILAWRSGKQIYCQRFDASFQPLTPPVLAGTGIGTVSYVRVSAAKGGAFIVSWHDSDQLATYARQYSADGTPDGNATAIDLWLDTPSGNSVGIAMLPDGGYLVVQNNRKNYLSVVRHAADGAVVGNATRVDGSDVYQFAPTVAVDETGAYVIAWCSRRPGELASHVYARLYAPDGAEASDVMRLDADRTDNASFPSASGAGRGQFVVTWKSGTESCAQRLSPAGLVGNPIALLVNGVVLQNAVAPSGAFVLAYRSSNNAQAWFYSPAGVPSAPFLAATGIKNVDAYDAPAVAVRSDGSFIFAVRQVAGTQVGFLLRRVALAPTLIILREPSTDPNGVQLRVSQPLASPPDGEQVTVLNRTTGRLLDPTEYDLRFDPTHSTLTLRLLGGDGQVPDGDYRLTVPASAVSDPTGEVMPADFVHDFFVLSGDVNRDRKVDFNDLVKLAQDYNTVGKAWRDGDFNGDGSVDFRDLAILAARYNTALPTPAAPAPPIAAPALPADTVSPPIPHTAKKLLPSRSILSETVLARRPPSRPKKILPTTRRS